MQRWDGFTRLKPMMAAYGYGTSQMVGDGQNKECTLTSSDGEIRAGFIFRGNSKTVSFFIITLPNPLNKEVLTCGACKREKSPVFSNKQ